MYQHLRLLRSRRENLQSIMPDMYRELSRLAESDDYPFHMPGHKRNVMSTPIEGAFRCDITEIEGFDNLHDESGIILEAEERANSLYGADSTFFLINGSTSGVLSAVSATVPQHGVILAARGSHKSLYHAAYLKNLDIRYLPIKINNNYNIPEGYRAEDIQPYLTDDVSAVFITSPTYEGKCSDIEAIAKLCHERNIPLIVDAAHGAHFGFGKKCSEQNKENAAPAASAEINGYTESKEYTDVPESAVRLGADIVIHSVHKTLPSMTQTALIHVTGDLVNREMLKRFLRIYQSSSPSYVLMASIDRCMAEMEQSGDKYIANLLKYRNMISEETRELKNIFIPGVKEVPDPCKILITDASGTMTGQQIYDILREEYALQFEMAGEKIALAIITGSDREDGIKRLIEALKEIDKKIELEAKDHNTDPKEEPKEAIFLRAIPKRGMTITKAWDAKKEKVRIEEAVGLCAGDFINLYPPGIPMIVPGEIFSEDIAEEIKRYRKGGLNLQGIEPGEGADDIFVFIATDRKE